MWKFLHSAPPHYTTLRLHPSEIISIDGRLDEAAWSASGVEWTMPMRDITRHKQPIENVVPASLQARAKFRWDASFLYVGVELREPFIVANITGHNGPNPPYHDNDVELFVDVSGSTQYYKEFELSARNATYDVLWGVPDGESLICSREGRGPQPTCVNTSFPGYAGNWSMVSPGRSGLGLTTATNYSTEQYGRYVSPYAVWTAEMAFPLHSGGEGDSWHGGLLDAGPPYEGRLFPDADPEHVRPSGAPVYWHFDLSRAEHPRRYTPPPSERDGIDAPQDVYCPRSCSAHNLSGWAPELGAPTKDECAAVRTLWPTLLGVDPWNCYWEWALADVGANAYMHVRRPVAHCHRLCHSAYCLVPPPDFVSFLKQLPISVLHARISPHRSDPSTGPPSSSQTRRCCHLRRTRQGLDRPRISPAVRSSGLDDTLLVSSSPPSAAPSRSTASSLEAPRVSSRRATRVMGVWRRTWLLLSACRLSLTLVLVSPMTPRPLATCPRHALRRRCASPSLRPLLQAR